METMTLEGLTAESVAFEPSPGSAPRLVVRLSGGSEVAAPLDWFPRLAFATAEEREAYELHLGGRAIHWPLLNEDVRVSDLILGRHSEESPESLSRWRELMVRRRAQIERGEEPEPHYPTLPLPDWWDEEDGSSEEAGDRAAEG